MAQTEYSISAVFRAVDNLTRPIQRMHAPISRFTQATERSLGRINRSFSAVESSIKSIGATAATVGVIGGTAFANVVSVGAAFEQSLVSAAAKFPGEIKKGTDAFQALEDAARKTGASTEFSASQAAESINFLAMAGFSAESAITALPVVVDLATAASIDLAEATDVASDALGAFGMGSKDAAEQGANLTRITDVLAKTTTTANTTVGSMFETIKQAAATGKTAGVSLETFAALTGKLANAGIKGSDAGTTLKNTFLALAAPGTQAAKILSRLGVRTQDTQGNLRDIIDVMGDLNRGLDGLGTSQRSAALKGIFGLIPISGVNVLLAEGSEELKRYREQLRGATGDGRKMATVMRDTVQGRINSLKSAIEAVKISIFTMVKGPLADAITSMTDWVRANEKVIATKVGEFLADIINNFSEIVGWVKTIGKGILIFMALSAVLRTLAAVMTIVNVVMLANPFGLVVLAITAVGAAIAALIIWWDDIVLAMSDFFTWFFSIPDMFVEAWGSIEGYFVSLWETITTTVEDGVDTVLGAIETMSTAINDFFTSELNPLRDVGGSLGTFAYDVLNDDIDPTAPAPIAPERASVIGMQSIMADLAEIEGKGGKSTTEITIKDETGRAEVTGGTTGAGVNIIQTGGF